MPTTNLTTSLKLLFDQTFGWSEHAVILVNQQCNIAASNHSFLSKVELPSEKVVGQALSEILALSEENQSSLHKFLTSKNPAAIEVTVYVDLMPFNLQYRTQFENCALFELIEKNKFGITPEGFKSAVKASGVGVWDWDVVNNELFWDESMYTLYEVHPQEFSGAYDAWLKTIHPDDAEASSLAVDQALKNEKKFNIEFRIKTAKRKIKYIQADAEVVFDENGIPIRMLGVNVDVTKQVGLRNELAANEEKFRSLFENSTVGIALNDMSGKFIEINKEFERFTGYSKNELNQLSYWDLTPKAYEKQEEQQLESLEKKGFYGPYEKEYIHKKGHTYPVLLNGVKVRNYTDGNDYIWSLVHDQSWRYEIQKNLKEYQKFFNISEEALCIADLDFNLERVNKKLEQLIGIKKEELLTKKLIDIIHPEDKDSVLKELSILIDNGKAVKFTSRILAENEEVYWIIWSAVLNENKEKVYITGQEATNLLLTQKALQKSNEELNNFAYVASHDLQEPLRVVSSYVRLIQEKYESQLDEVGIDFMKRTVSAAGRMGLILDDLLEYSRLDKNQMVFNEVDLMTVAQEVLSDAYLSIERTEAEITLDPLPKCSGDPTQIYRVFQNIISNSLKYKKKDVSPKIHISARELPFSIEIKIEDNGIGINQKFEDRVFLIFQRLHTRSDYPGTGVGLAIVKKIIERHQGKTWFTSDGKSGTTIYFTLPK